MFTLEMKFVLNSIKFGPPVVVVVVVVPKKGNIWFMWEKCVENNVFVNQIKKFYWSFHVLYKCLQSNIGIKISYFYCPFRYYWKYWEYWKHLFWLFKFGIHNLLWIKFYKNKKKCYKFELRTGSTDFQSDTSLGNSFWVNRSYIIDVFSRILFFYSTYTNPSWDTWYFYKKTKKLDQKYIFLSSFIFYLKIQSVPEVDS